MLRLHRTVYLDNNATTRPTWRVRRRVAATLAGAWANPSALYEDAHRAAIVIEGAREAVARAIGARPAEITFTGSATEANNTVLAAVAAARPGAKIVASPIEHPSVMETLRWLAARGTPVEHVAVDRLGRVDLADLARRVDERTALVAIMLANNETGVVQDVPAIARLAKARGARVMSDCVQALGKIPVDVDALGVDYATLSAHKIHGPKGVGALFVRAGAPIAPFVHGGHQERGLRAGTESTHNIAGLGAACEGVPALLADAPRIRARRDALLADLRRVAPGLACHSPDDGLPNTLSLTFPGVQNAVLMAMLDAHGVAVAAGSACNTPANEPSHVLRALGLSVEEARTTIRVSLSAAVSAADARYVVRVIDDHLHGRIKPIGMIAPAQLDEARLRHPDTYVLDVRFPYDRAALRTIPGAHEAGFFGFARYRHGVPRDKRIVVVCQGGLNAPVVAYHLRKHGYPDVSFLLGGMYAWALAQRGVAERLGDRPVERLAPRGRGLLERVLGS